jgi:spermidine synthase
MPKGGAVVIGIAELGWAAAGAGLTLVSLTLFRLYWRLWGPGSIQEYVAEEDEPDGDYRIIQKMKTPFQRIAVVETEGNTLIYGNGYVMFGTTSDDDLWAELMIHVPMALAQKRERVLIIGGGGGITTREVLRYTEVAEVTTVEIDDTMLGFGKSLEPLVRFNKGSLNDPKVRTVIQDGRAFVESNPGPWDLVVIDLPEPSEEAPGLKRLYSWEFYTLLAERLAPGGVVVVACSNPSWLPEYFWSVHATLKSAGFHVLPYRYDAFVDYEEDYGFHVAALRPISPADVRIGVRTRYLSAPRLEELFKIPLGIRELKGDAKVQRDTNNVLAALAEDDES